MSTDIHSYSLVDPHGRTRGSAKFPNFREAANGLGLSDYLVSQGWAVIQTDGQQPNISHT